MSEKLTPTQRKALEILAQHPKGIMAGDFALLMWPDSVMHRKVSNQGNGATRGKAGWLCGGSYLRKLQYRGLVWWGADHDVGMYSISDVGRAALAQTSPPDPSG